jgi:hypothetical protein
VAQSILDTTKKTVGLSSDDDSFDDDIVMHINTALSTLNQLGIGPTEGFEVEDSSATWDDFLGGDKRLNFVKTYVYLRVRLVFDPWQTSFVIDSMNKQIQELEWRMNVLREGEAWTDPTVPVSVPAV